MRLIDADKLLETLQDLEPHCANKSFEKGMLATFRFYMPQIINDEPIAYDIDKVVEELEERSKEYNSGLRLHGKPEEMRTDEAIEIVKQGGVSDDVCERR